MDETVRIRLSIKSARDVLRREIFSPPSPFCRIAIDGSGHVIQSRTIVQSVDPRFDQDFDLALSRRDSITISVWDQRKIHKSDKRKSTLGLVNLSPSAIARTRNKGPVRINLTPYKDVDTIKGSLLVEIKTRESRSTNSASSRSGTEVMAPLQPRNGRSEGDYFSRDALHGPPLPRGYERKITPHGQVYWLHRETGESSWYDPRFKTQRSQRPPTELGTGPLPEGWDQRETNTGRIYFINHRDRTTQFTDPRLEKTAPPLVPPKPVIQTLHEKLQALRSDLTRQFENTGRDLAMKIRVDRNDVFESSFQSISRIPTEHIHKRILIKFEGEDGIDYGGVTREWLYLLSHSMLDPVYGLFEYANEDIYALQISPNSTVNPDHLAYFKFIGRIIGLAIYHGHYIDGGFSPVLYKQILGLPFTLQDLETMDPDVHNSLRWMLNNDITDTGVDEQYFVVNWEGLGVNHEHLLCPAGDQMRLSEENKGEYVSNYLRWRFTRGTGEQYDSFIAGLTEVVPIPMLQKRFDNRELELVISGLGKLDLGDWRANTKYGNLTGDTELATWFWEIVTALSDVDQARLLQFATGTSRVPLAGFAALRGATNKDSNSVRPFTIVLIEADSDALPKAHTCFNRLDIPLYETKQKFEYKLLQAMNETIGFHTD